MKKRRHRAKKHLIPVGLNVTEYSTATAEDPFEAVCRADDERRLLALIEQLSPRQKQAITLCALEGRTQEEAAEVMGIDQSVVCRHLGRARGVLQRVLRAECIKSPVSPPYRVEAQIPAPVRDAYTEARQTNSGQGFLFTPVVYYSPKRGWLTPFMLAVDKQRYLDECFGDDLTRIPRGA